ncbi:thioesterase [Wenyingzhuangia fucanilytica]|uniref:Thioesterase n=1 Tax=Wenyingzhuangia fucanilytica TaxID=1790137 RepID=A0A1B1Y3Y3_9FLAO|nr:PaaI family thioesterase [Wenyingzhuangia fucanilytica]ANW95474.1 thioesterase [Wenyingzhuangia fucanilytica]
MDFEKALLQVNQFSKNTLMETLGIKYTEIGEDYLVATMPVNSKVHQPMGLLHGGATVALAESVGSAASFLFINPKEYTVKGIEISANHLKSKKEGVVTAKATIIHKGRTTHLWQITITDEEGALISLCKITNIVLPK